MHWEGGDDGGTDAGDGERLFSALTKSRTNTNTILAVSTASPSWLVLIALHCQNIAMNEIKHAVHGSPENPPKSNARAIPILVMKLLLVL